MGGLPWKEQSQLPMEEPCGGHTRAGSAGSWAPTPWVNTSDVRSIRRLGCPSPTHSPATEKLGLAFPILMPLKSLGCGWGEPESLTLKAVSAAGDCAGWSGSAGLLALVLPRFAQHLGQVTYNGDDASCPPREQGYQGER